MYKKPVLNGYIYPKQTIQMSLSKVLGMPKIETLTLLKGADSESNPAPIQSSSGSTSSWNEAGSIKGKSPQPRSIRRKCP